MSNDLTLTTFFQDFRSGMKEHLEQISVFTIALTTNILEDMGIEIKTQTEIRAMNLALEINMCKTNIDRMYQQYSNSTDHVTAQKYVDAAKVLEAEMKASVNALNELANNNQATISHNPLETAKNIVKDSRFSVELFDKLSKAASVTSIGKELIDFVESYKFTGDVDEKELNDVAKEIAGFVSSFAETPRLDKVIKAIGLNPKSLFTVAAKSSLISWIVMEEYQFVYNLAKDYFTEKGLYDNECFIKWIDRILDPINGVTITNPTDFNAVSSVYSLLQANTSTPLTDKQWTQLFGSDEVRKMDMNKVKNILKASIKLVTGKDVEMDSVEDMINIVQGNYKAFKDIRGFELIAIEQPKLMNALKFDELYDTSDIGLAYRYTLKNLNSFVITSNEKVSINYAQHNANGELDMWSPESPNGMTVEYIQDRAKMLWFKIAYDSYKDIFHNGLPYDEEFNMPIGVHLPNMKGDYHFIDEESGITLKIDATDFTTFTNHYIHFGTAGDDKLTGDALQDKLYGGLGSDRLDGGLGNDYMEGGKGYDSYQINGNDTVFDSDGNGFIHMGDYLLNKFEAVDEKNSIWYSIDDDGNRTGFIAYKINENDLFVKGNGHSVTIQNFFQVAQKIGNSFDGLNIQLFSKEEQQSTLPETSDYLLWTGDIRPNTQIIHNDDGSITDTGIYDMNWTDHSQRNEKGEIINGIRQYGFADVIYGQVNVNNKIYGLSGNDALSVNNRDDLLLGGDGQDLITGGGGSDTIYGGSGDDEIIASNNNDVIYGDKMDNETAETSNDGNDNIYGMAGDDLIYGGSGDDFIRGDGVSRVSSLAFLPVDQHGNDIIYAGDGNDTVYGNGGDDVIFGEDGDDFIGGDFNNETDNETESANLIDANGDDFIDGGSGNDTIQGGGADDVVMGGDDNDRIWGDYGHSELFHISGNDTLDGGDGKDEIYGGGGDDVIAGGNGDDFLVGDFSYNEKTTSLADINGNDFIDAGDGNDEILAGGGNDNILGGIGNDLIFGDYNNTIPQIFGNDYIDGQDGDDEIIGGGGDDSIVGGVGNDRIFGDFGTNNPDAMQISGNDIIDGQDGDDVLFGSGGDDTIDGGDGNDIIYGDLGDEEEVSHIKGNDYLNGGNGHDTIYGNAGDDTLVAGKGNDQLIGGKGEDTYLFNSEDLRNEDVQYNVILDEDGKGAIVIDGVYLHEQNWKATAENRWETDNMLLEKREIDAYTFLIWQSKETNALIGVQDYKNGDLNLNLPKYQPKPIITVNHEPIVNLILTEQTIKTNEEYSFRLPENLFADPDGDDLTLSIENLPNWLHFDGHALLGTPLIDDTGNLKLNIIATDPYGASTSQTLELNIENPNQAPAVDQIIATQTITANQEWTFRLPENMFIDPDGDDLSFEINKLPN